MLARQPIVGAHPGSPSLAMKTLILVDLQAAFPVPASLLAAIKTEAANYECRVFTRFINPEGSLFRRKLKMHDCAPGSADTRLLLEPGECDTVLDKEGYGLLPDQIVRLTARGIKRADVCGIDTDACVLGVMFSLFDAGIEGTVLPHLCWSSGGLHDEALRIIGSQFTGSPK